MRADSAVEPTNPHVNLRGSFRYSAMVAEPRQPLTMRNLTLRFDQQFTGHNGVPDTFLERRGYGLVFAPDTSREVGERIGYLDVGHQTGKAVASEFPVTPHAFGRRGGRMGRVGVRLSRHVRFSFRHFPFSLPVQSWNERRKCRNGLDK